MNFSRLWQWPVGLKGTKFTPHAALGFKSLNHCLVSQQQPFGLFSSAASQLAPRQKRHVLCLDNRWDKNGIWENLGHYCEVAYSSIRGIAVLLGLWQRAAGITAQGREVTPKGKKGAGRSVEM